MESWAAVELRHTHLGDKRLNRRLVLPPSPSSRRGIIWNARHYRRCASRSSWPRKRTRRRAVARYVGCW